MSSAEERETPVHEIDHPPDAAAMMESIRAIGYDPGAAIADLIDNSISAKAKTIDILYPPGDAGNPIPRAIGIQDDGVGMTRDELLVAMCMGAKRPTLERRADDLGRFGLGLKTASLSQCKRLTVVSRIKGGSWAAMQWDIERVIAANKWTILQLNQAEISRLPLAEEFLTRAQGTMVLWEEIDRFVRGKGDLEREFTRQMGHVRDHLALVFHRFLDGDLPRVAIAMNRTALPKYDPFLTSRSTYGPQESIPPGGPQHTSITIRPYTLPHISNMTRDEISLLGPDQGYEQDQGFYVYRAGRLLVRGTWFRMAPRQASRQYARIQVDVPNSLDHAWSLDIKKSAATPPLEVRERLKALIPTLARPSERANDFTGRKTAPDAVHQLWQRHEMRGGNIRYGVNPEHPFVKAVQDRMQEPGAGTLHALLNCLAECLPVEGIYQDRAKATHGHRPDSEEQDGALADIETLCRGLLAQSRGSRPEQLDLLDRLRACDPIRHMPNGQWAVLRGRLEETIT